MPDTSGVLKVLLLGNARSPFVIDLARYLKRQETVVLGLVSDPAPRDGLRPEEIFDDVYIASPNRPEDDRVRPLSTLVLYFKTLRALWRRRERYDCLHIHFFGWFHAALALAARHFFPRIVVSIYGADFYRAGPLAHRVQRRALSSMDLVTVSNPETGRQLRRKYGARRLPPIAACSFGLTPLAELRKAVETTSVKEARRRLGIPPDAVAVTCAYNRSPGHRHLAIIEQVGTLSSEIRDSLFLVLPLTYGGASPGYVESIEERLTRTGVRHLVLTSYLSNLQTAELRLATDIFIHVPISDQLSGTMQEHLFAGSVVVTGSWLPYSTFRELGVVFLEVARIEDLARLIPSVLDDLENLKTRARVNRELIWELSNWDTRIPHWIDVYREALEARGETTSPAGDVES